ncbi:HAD family hydrolase [Paenibacillus tarimensis]|uniref:HAD family hydrolase n=1 Tax=Paenibacillus tarimensis TaxID=416012 RepID=UPI001F461E7A|nr:HAD family hydrolase [Paenibacillus tarimensis]MCF2944112.1 HAD family hydrolase [Paenibacillus tarimensis]
MTVIVFDLDDTLYSEISFVRSGFQAVATYLEENFKVDKLEAFDHMWTILQLEGRGAVFNSVLQRYGIACTQRNIRKCLSVYRLHNPDIKLLPDANLVLDSLNAEGYPIYIVTDGNKVVQHRKIAALGLYPRIQKAFITYRYGRHHSKPSPHCFIKIAQMEHVPPSEIVYIGDNPHKDFVGIKPLGFRTIQIKRGPFSELQKTPEYHADMYVDNLEELLPIIKSWKV